MNFDTILLAIGIISLTFGVTLLILYSALGPGSTKLIDPFEEGDK